MTTQVELTMLSIGLCDQWKLALSINPLEALFSPSQAEWVVYRYIITHECVNLNGFQTMVRDRVLETLRLTASELESDVSANSTNPAYLSQADFLPHSYF